MNGDSRNRKINNHMNPFHNSANLSHCINERNGCVVHCQVLTGCFTHS